MRKKTILYLSALAVMLSLVALSSAVSWGQEAPLNSPSVFLPYCSKPRMDIFVGDFDGDGRSDLGVYRGKDNSFHVLLSTGKRFGDEGSGQWVAPNQFGNPDGEYYIGDYDGDGKSDLGFFDYGDNSFHVSLSTGERFGAIGSGPWGGLDDFRHHDGQFYVAFFNGGLKSDLGFFDRTDNSFWVSLSTGSEFDAKHSGQWIAPGVFGHANGRYYTGDFNRDGSEDLAFFEPADNSLHITTSDGKSFDNEDSGRWIDPNTFGNKDGEYYVGDYDGDGDADLGFFEPGNNSFYVARSNRSGFPNNDRERWIEPNAFGHSGGQFFVGDFNGGGKDDLGFYDPADGSFTVGLSTGYPGFDFKGSGVWATITP